MRRLALTFSASPHETPTAYLSRLAARNLAPDLWSFCRNLGLDLAALTTGDEAAVAQLRALAGLPPNTFQGTNILKVSTMRYRVGSEVMNTETLSRGDIRLCPVCIAEQVETGRPCWNIVHPLHWQIIHLGSCIEHDTVLRSFRPGFVRAARFDVAGFVRENTVAVLAAATERDTARPADRLDRYLATRIYGHQIKTWCDCLEWPALMKACDAFGVLVDHGRDARASSLPADIRRAAMLTGFEILEGGPESIRAALDHFNGRTPTRGGSQPHPSTGEVQRLLGSHAKMRSDLDPLRDVVRAYFLDTYPFRPGTTVLGQKVTECRVYSLRAACRQIGIRRSLVEEMLIRRGQAARDTKGVIQLDAVLSTTLVNDLRSEASAWLNQQQTAKHLGCSFAMFKQLQRSGVLVPAEGAGHRARKGFHREQLNHFLEKVGTKALRVWHPPVGTCTLEIATRKANCSVPDIVRLLLTGELSPAGCLSDRIGLQHLLVRVTELMAALPQEPGNGIPLGRVSRELFLNMATLRVLIAQGLIVARRLKSSRTRVTNELITTESLAAFRAKYCTLRMLAAADKSFACLRHTSLRRLGVTPAVDGVGLRKVYRREDIQRVLEQERT